MNVKYLRRLKKKLIVVYSIFHSLFFSLLIFYCFFIISIFSWVHKFNIMALLLISSSTQRNVYQTIYDVDDASNINNFNRGSDFYVREKNDICNKDTDFTNIDIDSNQLKTNCFGENHNDNNRNRSKVVKNIDISNVNDNDNYNDDYNDNDFLDEENEITSRVISKDNLFIFHNANDKANSNHKKCQNKNADKNNSNNKSINFPQLRTSKQKITDKLNSYTVYQTNVTRAPRYM